DGGGVRGLSQLIILRELMDRVKSTAGLATPPLPGEYFDLIGGTGTGGLIALMLGPLRMSVADAITTYGQMSEQVFSEKKWKGKDSTFKASKLEDFIKGIVAAKLGNSGAQMLDLNRDDPCKAFVCAMPAFSISAAIPRLFRTYQVPKGLTFNCMIWEAARATSASPKIFKPIKIGDSSLQELFIGGGIGCNNPIRQILQEAELLFPSKYVACVLSIGAGHSKTISFASTGGLFSNVLPLSVCTTLHSIATDGEGTAEEIARQFQTISDFYFRFNVDQGLQSFKLGEWYRLSEVQTHAEQYLRTISGDRMLTATVQALTKPSNNLLTLALSKFYSF
ncbi:hypothetical protein JAAARDRAFT_136390, partial [Jaapia argillacea MUCL 33604]